MAEKSNWIERNKRNYLKDIIPLEMPLSIQIEPTGACNFKCCYCYHSLEKSKQRPSKMLSLDLYKKFIADSKEFSEKYKSLTFCGGGEPLLNKDIFEMIKLAKEVSNQVVILTNASLLMPEVSDKLIESGLDILRVSMQGICAEDYKKNCGVDIDFEAFVKNIDYFYKHKKNSKIFLKVPDIAIDTEEKKEAFYKIFETKCDDITVQIISSFVEDIDYSKIKRHKGYSLYGDKIEQIKVCPQMFFTMIIDQFGKIFPCSDAYYNLNDPVIGDLSRNTIKEIWNSDELRDLRISHLKGERFNLNTCKNCNHVIALNNKFDNIDDYAENILKMFLEQR